MADELPIYWRNGRAYFDGRRWGGKQVSLGTTDPTIAKEMAETRVMEMDAAAEAERVQARKTARLAATLGLDASASFDDYAGHHLAKEEAAGILNPDAALSPDWLAATELMLARALHFFDVHQVETTTAAQRARRPGLFSPRNLGTISTPDVGAFATWLTTEEFWAWEVERRKRDAHRLQRPAARGKEGPYGPQHVRHHLSALSKMFRRAVSEGVVQVNPCRELMDKPAVPKSRTGYLPPPQIALLIEAARTLQPDGPLGGRPALSCGHELVAFLCLTGARMDEARRMEWKHVHFHSGALEIPGTKTEDSDRVVPLHAQLAEILQAYRRRTGRMFGPLFPSELTGEAFGDPRKVLNAVADRAGVPREMVRSRPLRASWATARVVSLDNGKEVTPEMVRQEMGHSCDSITLTAVYVKRARAVLERLDPFEFRIERYRDRPEIADALARMEAVDAEPFTGKPRVNPDTPALVAAFLAAVDGLSLAEAMNRSGVERAAIQRMRAGTAQAVKGKTRDRMRAFLERLAAA